MYWQKWSNENQCAKALQTEFTATISLLNALSWGSWIAFQAFAEINQKKILAPLRCQNNAYKAKVHRPNQSLKITIGNLLLLLQNFKILPFQKIMCWKFIVLLNKFFKHTNNWKINKLTFLMKSKRSPATQKKKPEIEVIELERRKKKWECTEKCFA